MAIKQISAFLENRPGTLCDAVDSMKEAGINIRALSVAETKEYGILRIIVSDTEKTKEILTENYIVKETPVIAVEMRDQSGALSGILKILKDAGVNIEYVYAFTSPVRGSAYVVLRVDDIEEGEKILLRNGIKTLDSKDLAGVL